MRLSRTLLNAFTLLLFPALIGTTVLYSYPLLFSCTFPEPGPPRSASLSGASTQYNASASHSVAPFRLLVFGDPQLEGDSSLPKPSDPAFPSLTNVEIDKLFVAPRNTSTVIASAFKDLVRRDIPLLLWSYRKRLDLFGNDYYLAHIYRTLHWWLAPSHVAVLGDLLGSQWITDEEFSSRAHRYWDRVFAHGRRVEDKIMQDGWTETLGADPSWATRIINVAGNHDIGYSGDITVERMTRFEEAFGKTDWDVRFQLPGNDTLDGVYGPPELRIIVLNDMNLDGPVHDTDLQDATYSFINTRLIGTSRPVEDTRSATLLLTHVPLHKRAGICVDGPLIEYHANGLVREQNHLSPGSSLGLLEGIFGMTGTPDAPMGGMGRNGIILTGHDHEGCDVWHHIDHEENVEGQDEDADVYTWSATRFTSSNRSQIIPGIREITVRSMMGAYGGNAGLISGWFDTETQIWRFEYATCPVGVQHYWWAVHVLDIILVVLGITGIIAWVLEQLIVAKKGASAIDDNALADLSGNRSTEVKAVVATAVNSSHSSVQRRLVSVH